MINQNRIAGGSNSFCCSFDDAFNTALVLCGGLWIGLAHLRDSTTSLLPVGHHEPCSTSMKLLQFLKSQAHPGRPIDFIWLGSSGQQLMSNVLKNEFFTERPDCRRGHCCQEQGAEVVCGRSSAEQSRYESVRQLPMAWLTVEVAN